MKAIKNRKVLLNLSKDKSCAHTQTTVHIQADVLGKNIHGFIKGSINQDPNYSHARPDFMDFCSYPYV